MFKDLPDNSIDLILSDPPFGITSCKWDIVIPLESMWTELRRIIKPNGAIVLMAAQPFTSKLIMSNPSWFKYCWYWNKNRKTGFLNAKIQPLRQVEELCVFYNKQPIYNPQKTTGHKPVNSFIKRTGDGETLGKTKKGFKGGGQTDRYPTNIIKIPVVKNDNSGRDKIFSTQKPIALMEYIIKTYTNPKDIVLDFAMGSGTTGVGCRNLDRSFIGIDSSLKAFDIARMRIGS